MRIDKLALRTIGVELALGDQELDVPRSGITQVDRDGYIWLVNTAKVSCPHDIGQNLW